MNKNNGLKIDFAQSIDDIMDLFKRLFDAIETFFKTLFGIDVFVPENKATDGDANA